MIAVLVVSYLATKPVYERLRGSVNGLLAPSVACTRGDRCVEMYTTGHRERGRPTPGYTRKKSAAGRPCKARHVTATALFRVVARHSLDRFIDGFL